MDILYIDTIIRRCDKAFGSPVSMRVYYPELLRKIHHAGKFIYAYAEEVLGYMALYANNLVTNVAYITLLAVSPEYQGSHIGTNLLVTGMDIARSYGMESCILEVKKTNEKAMRFYQSKGFVFLESKKESFLLQRTLMERETYEHKRKESNLTGNGNEGLRDDQRNV